MNNIYLFQVLAGTAFTMVPILFTFFVFLCLRGLPALAHRQAAAASSSSDPQPLSRMRAATPVAMRSFESLVHAETNERRVEPMWVRPILMQPELVTPATRSARTRESRWMNRSRRVHETRVISGIPSLGATGFEIGLETQGSMTSAFILWSPEGKGLFAGPNLEELKHVAEQND